MVLLIIFSYAILFTCIVGIYSLHLYIDKMSPFFQQYKYVFYGILLGVTGILLTGASFASFGGYMVNMRIIPVLIAGLIGSPQTIVITALITGISRLFMGSLNDVLLYGSIMYMIFSAIIAIVSTYYPITFANISRYFCVFLFATTCYSVFVVYPEMGDLPLLLAFIICTIILFVLIRIVLEKRTEEAQLIAKASFYERFDTVTNIPNHKWIYETCQQKIDAKQPFSFIRCRTTSLAEIQQSYGHIILDDLFEESIREIKHLSYPYPFTIARLDSTDFILFLDNAPPAIALDFASHFKRFTENLELRHAALPKALQVEIAIGVCSYPYTATTVIDLINLSGKALTAANDSATGGIVYANDL